MTDPAFDAQFEIKGYWGSGDIGLEPADHAVISFVGESVLLTIGQTNWPIFQGPDDPEMVAMRESGTVEIEPIARFILTPATALKFAKAFRTLETGLEQLLANQGKPGGATQ